MSAGLEVRDLQARTGGRLILDVGALDVPAGELVVLSGDAGSGKSALASVLGGMLAAGGTVKVGGAAAGGTPSRRRRLGLAVAVRDAGRITGVTVAEALALAAGAGARAHEALDRFPELEPRRRVLAQLLSGGEQQLLQVACAWAATPKALVLDAPAVGLAQRAADAVVALARDEAARGCAVLWLEADVRAAPEPPRQRLVRGRLEAAAASASDPG
ncbi:MAG: ATP-binding cassette domain-containing protein [Candidatus Dormibacteraeota bacterium]|nr:ATP-binding cassette domain-containing protein [Candidatus Dormibacteraeota bacterium]